jgi:hypothetical protein
MREKIIWGHVSLRVAPDDDGSVVLFLDGSDFTFETNFDALLAFRLGQALVRLSRKLGLPDGLVDASVD